MKPIDVSIAPDGSLVRVEAMATQEREAKERKEGGRKWPVSYERLERVEPLPNKGWKVRPKTPVGTALETTRKSLGLSIHAASELTGISVSTLKRIERNDANTRIGTIEYICEAYKISVFYVFKMADQLMLPVMDDDEDKDKKK